MIWVSPCVLLHWMDLIHSCPLCRFAHSRMMGIRDVDLLARWVFLSLPSLGVIQNCVGMNQYQEDTRNDVLRKAEKLEKDGWESYLNS
ncbi:hypothetical protein CMV_023518 [Castanea mollissima]|uniref:Uncharacterized protein n=1 Tax=Castanea mollissima TaxID=60419 RepID=A0A8J4QGD5_9ROSI|nr:hypothetical protein CMV_023518 [Castanea mollissima]